MTDLGSTITAKSDQLNADDLIAGPRTVHITDVQLRGGDQPVAISYDGDEGRPFLPCKSMRRVLVHVWGSDGKKYVGRQMTLYRDPTVKYAGQEVGGIRISHMSHIDKKVVMSLTASKMSKKPYTVHPLKNADKPKAQEKPEVVAEEADIKSDNTQELIAAGNKAAAGGVESYKKWTATLSDEDKNKVRDNHNSWVAEAKKADAGDDELPM